MRTAKNRGGCDGYGPASRRFGDLEASRLRAEIAACRRTLAAAELVGLDSSPMARREAGRRAAWAVNPVGVSLPLWLEAAIDVDLEGQVHDLAVGILAGLLGGLSPRPD